jgi:ankyrin repeat protein
MLHVESIKYYLEKYMKTISDCIINGDVQGLQELIIQSGDSININAKLNKGNEYSTPLCLAAKHGQVAVIEYLVDKCGFNYSPEAADKALYSANWSSLQGQAKEDTMFCLLKMAEQQCNISQYVETSVFTHAILYGYKSFKFAEELLSFVTDTTRKQKLLDEHFLDMVLVKESEAIKFCVSQGANVKTTGDYGQNALQLAKSVEADIELLQYLQNLQIEPLGETVDS